MVLERIRPIVFCVPHALLRVKNTLWVHPCLPVIFFAPIGPPVPLLGPTVAQQWDTKVPTAGTHCCASDLGSQCKNYIRHNNGLE
jgi:hypothetical protein